MALKRLLNETTNVAAEMSAAEISKELVAAGALQIATQYRNGQISGLSWSMMVRGHEAFFAMPARVDGVFNYFLDRNKTVLTPQRKQELRDKAQRVAWRHLYRWVQAQVAMIRTGMMEPAEPFIPFVTIPGNNQTLFEAFAETRGLPMPEQPQ